MIRDKKKENIDNTTSIENATECYQRCFVKPSESIRFKGEIPPRWSAEQEKIYQKELEKTKFQVGDYVIFERNNYFIPGKITEVYMKDKKFRFFRIYLNTRLHYYRPDIIKKIERKGTITDSILPHFPVDEHNVIAKINIQNYNIHNYIKSFDRMYKTRQLILYGRAAAAMGGKRKNIKKTSKKRKYYSKKKYTNLRKIEKNLLKKKEKERSQMSRRAHLGPFLLFLFFCFCLCPPPDEG